MANRVGPSFCIALTIKDRAFDASTVNSMEMSIPMNGMPNGTFSVMITDDANYKVDSGCYGYFMFLNTGMPDVDGKGFSFYVLNATQTIVNEATTKLTVKWICATEETLKRRTLAITGTSLDAMIDVLKSYDKPIPYTNFVMANAAGLTDTMTWRYTNSTLEDILVHTVEHSALNGDYLFWTYDESLQKIVFSSLGVSSKTSKPQALIYSQNALASTNSVMYTDPNTGSRLWLYGYEERSNKKGERIEDIFPSIVFSNITSEGKADVSKCGGACFDKVVTRYGAKNSSVARKEYGIDDKNSVFGELNLVDDFPLNTHKSYPVAKMIRDRIYAEYSKLMSIGIYNSIGPAVGSTVYVRALKVTRNGSNGGPDMNYTDEYIVLAKKIRKEGTAQAGALGNELPNQSADYMTVLLLGSKSTGIDGYKPTSEKLENIAKACNVEQEKK